jgi:hypothetical protein
MKMRRRQIHISHNGQPNRRFRRIERASISWHRRHPSEPPEGYIRIRVSGIPFPVDLPAWVDGV